MNWSLYGWFMLFSGVVGLLVVGVEPKRVSPEVRVGRALLYLAFYMPLIGHLVGWW